ncbi:MAG: hypothetical protein OHK0012_04730 [Synechococcales cyanobacterium]
MGVLSTVLLASAWGSRPAHPIFQEDPTVVTLVDVVACLTLFQNPGSDLTANQIATSVTAILGQPIATLNPVPTVANCNFVAPTTNGVELADVVAVLVAFQNPGTVLTPGQLISGVNGILGGNLPETDVVTIPGSPNPNPTPTPTPTATPGTPTVVTTLADESGSNPDACSLREAIVANNNLAAFGGCENGQGQIEFDDALQGTITLTNDSLIITNNLVIAGPGPDVITVSGDSQFRVFDITDSPTVDIGGLAIINGRATNPSDNTQSGGGIRAGDQVTLTVRNSTISGNTSNTVGGGIDADRLTVLNSTISANSSRIGGGIHSDSLLVRESVISNNLGGRSGAGLQAQVIDVSGSTISDNVMTDFGDGAGMIGNTITVSNSVLSNNIADEGSGGAILAFFVASVTNSTLTGNSAETYGGGVFSRFGQVTVTSSTLTGNSARRGGGLAGLSLTVTNTTLSGNLAGDYGGGINATTLVMTNSTLSGNSAESGGGLRSIQQATLNNSIISGNLANSNRECVGTSVAINITGSNNLIGVLGNPGGCPATGNTTAIAELNEIISPLADNGGVTAGPPGQSTTILTHALPAGSPAINGGSNTLIPSGVSTDQRGEGFARIVGGTVDMGAFERQ